MLVRIKEQGSAAFDQLFHQLYARLCVFADRYIDNEEAAKDIVSDLFLTLWNERGKLSDVKDVSAYLYVAARYRSLNYLRHSHMLRKHELQLQQSWLAGEQLAIDQPIYEAETIRLLYKAVDELPSECRQVAMLSLQGLSTGEIARQLQITPAAVSNQKARAVRLLKFKIPAIAGFILYSIFNCN